MKLIGLSEIAEYERRTRRYVRHLIDYHGYPARKIMGAWESDTVAIEGWRSEFLRERQFYQGDDNGAQ